MTSSSYNLTHLKVLEAESIHIIRDVVAEFERPVMLYSIGKDSAVMLRLAHKAFHPGRLPFPLLGHRNGTGLISGLGLMLPLAVCRRSRRVRCLGRPATFPERRFQSEAFRRALNPR
jgi:hypothetical protein